MNVDGEEDVDKILSNKQSLLIILMRMWRIKSRKIYSNEEDSINDNQNNQNTQPANCTTLNSTTCNRLGEGILEGDSYE